MYRRHIMPTGYMYRIHSYRYKQFILAAEYTLHTPARGLSAVRTPQPTPTPDRGPSAVRTPQPTPARGLSAVRTPQPTPDRGPSAVRTPQPTPARGPSAARTPQPTPARGPSAECEDTPPSQHRLIHAQPADVMAGTDGSPGQLSSAHTPLVLLLLIITISLLSQALSC